MVVNLTDEVSLFVSGVRPVDFAGGEHDTRDTTVHREVNELLRVELSQRFLLLLGGLRRLSCLFRLLGFNLVGQRLGTDGKVVYLSGCLRLKLLVDVFFVGGDVFSRGLRWRGTGLFTLWLEARLRKVAMIYTQDYNLQLNLLSLSYKRTPHP